MSKSTCQTQTGQPGPSDVRAQRAGTSERTDSWTLRVPKQAVDARTALRGANKRPLSRAKYHLLMILETYCRARCYCFVKNETLADQHGSNERAIQRLLEALEVDGVIRRVEVPGRKRRRAGIILLKRIDPDLPVADPETIPDVIEQLLARAEKPPKRRRETCSSTAKMTCSSTAKMTCSSTAKMTCPLELRGSSEEDEVESSSSKTDDDEPASLSGGGEETGKGEAIEAVQLCLGEDAAEIVEGDAAEIVEAIEGSDPWKRVEYAAYMATVSRKRVERPKPWLIATANKFPPSGPTVEARKAKAKVLERERRRRESASIEATRTATAAEAESPEWWLEKLGERGYTLELKSDDVIQFVKLRPDAPPVFGHEQEALKAIKPAMLDLLKARAELTPQPIGA